MRRTFGLAIAIALLLVATTPTAVLAAPPVGSTYSVSEQSGGFSWSGVNRIDDFSSYGDGGHFFWTYASPYDGANCLGGGQDSGTWTTGLPSSGYYEVQVFIPGRNAGTNNAVYQITTTGGVQPVSVNQALYFGWVSLGTHHVSQGRLFLPDITGEACATKKLGYDTVRWIYRGQVGSPDKGRGGGAPGDRTGPSVSYRIERTPADRPFHVRITGYVDDRSTGGSGIDRITWQWAGKPIHTVWFGLSSSYLQHSLQVPVFEVRPNTSTTLFVRGFDRAGNQSGISLSWRTPNNPVYLALGDSFPAGWHGADINHAVPKDPAYGYPFYVTQSLRAEGAANGWGYFYRNLAVSGWPTDAVRRGQLPAALADLRARRGSWNVVTLTAGANDTDWEARLKAWYLSWRVGRIGCPGDPAVPVARIRDGIRSIVTPLRGEDSLAAIVVTGYPNPFGGRSKCYPRADTTVQLINASIRQGLTGIAGVRWADYSNLFRNAGRFATDLHPWIQHRETHSDGGFPHPNTQGHRAIAGHVYGCRPWVGNACNP